MLASLIAPAVLFIQSSPAATATTGDRGVLRRPLPARALPAVGRGGFAPPRAGPERAVRLAGRPCRGGHRGGGRDAVRSARRPARPRLAGEALLVVRAEQFPRRAGRLADPVRIGRLAEPAETWLPRITGSRRSSCRPPARPARPGRCVRRRRDAALPAVAHRTGRRATRSSGCSRSSAGSGRSPACSLTFEILAHQVALAVERILLRQEVIRRGSEAYFRTLVQDTSDAILIVGDDGKVGYASPSATSIFGDVSMEGVAFLGAGRGRGAGRGGPRADADAGARWGTAPATWTADHPRDGLNVQVQLRCSDLRGDQPSAGWSSPCGT